MIKAIKFVSLPVTDQDRALEFFTKQLGFAIVTDQPFDEVQRWIELRVSGAQTRLVLFTAEGQEERIGTLSGISFQADDVEKTYQKLSEWGVEFLQPPQKADWGTAAVFKDPDGNMFVLSSR